MAWFPVGEMDTLSFIATAIQALVWPIVVIVVVLLLRTPLSNSVPLLKKLNALGVEVEFSTQLAEVSEKISGIDINVDQNQGENQVLDVSGETSSVEVVLEAWLELRNVIIDVARKLELLDDDTNIGISLKYLKDKGKIDTALFKVIQELEGMKNKALSPQGAAIAIDEAKTYAFQVKAISQHLQSL
jgi:hypothetical protein